MTMNAKRRRVHNKLASLPGVRPLRRPVSPGSAEQFDLYYVRTGPRTSHPLVIIPGGPGLASILVYKGFRRRAAATGLDVIMIEHRGVGISRHDDSGADLPPHALTVNQVVDDVAAVLDDAQVDTAVIYGASYGTYIAAGVGVRHPGRVRGMVLDSPVLSRHDIAAVRDAIRRVLWYGDHPETAAIAPKVRRLAEAGVMTPTAAQLAAAVYGYGGASLLNRQLDLLLQGRTLLWRALGWVLTMTTHKAPYRYEIDLVSRIALRELDYAPEPDGLPLDPAVAMRELIPGTATFEAEPFDLVAELPKFSWPTAVVSGGRDLTTPPAVAERVASLLPNAVLLTLPTMGHSALETRERAALTIASAVCLDELEKLVDQAPTLDAFPVHPALRLVKAALGVAAAVEGGLPVSLADLGRWVPPLRLAAR
ncbi:alpha/beta fold hydrolase [Mycobacterium noviomagense]|nr:alpha/beta fold hydrolase [Mycobacterium noviomagense]ORB18266.1 alpha/beta hydrolase [Mycobacterium noviomagense]